MYTQRCWESSALSLPSIPPLGRVHLISMHESTHTRDTLERVATTRERSVQDHARGGTGDAKIHMHVCVWVRVYIYERGS